MTFIFIYEIDKINIAVISLFTGQGIKVIPKELS